jgi:transcription antitermination protein NusB
MTQNNSTSPTRSRDKVLQSLYEIEVGGASLTQVLKDQFTKKNYPYYKDLLEGVVGLQENIDITLEKVMDRPLKDLDPIERNALRLAVYEFQNTSLDRPIIINESIRLTKKYGAAEGYKYVNAILDKILKEPKESPE